MSEKCLKCFRPVQTCYCKYIKQVPVDVKFIFLMHPKEAYKQKTGTGRLSHLSLPESEIIIGIDFTKNKRIQELLNDKNYFPLLLYPGEDSWTAGGEVNGKKMKDVLENKKLLVFVVDATWFLAKKMLRLSPNLRECQKISFRAGYRSQFTFKTQPQEECLSTIESCYYLIKELYSAGVIKEVNPEPLMEIFHKMIDFQIESQKQRIESGEPDRYSVAGTIRARKKELRLLKEKLKEEQVSIDKKIT